MKALILAGGDSSRMKTDKALLKRNGLTQVERLRGELEAAGLKSVFISARADSAVNAANFSTPILHDEGPTRGPAAALLRAYGEDAVTDWFILACDFPLVQASDIAWLIDRHVVNPNVDITCYSHSDGTPEPLFAIWTPNALRRLRANVATGFTGPIHTLSESEVQLYLPRNRSVLTNTNTPDEWTNVPS